MNEELHELVTEALEAAKERGMKQKDLAEISSLDVVGLSRLKKANDAIVVDNSFMTFDEQVAGIIALANKKINA